MRHNRYCTVLDNVSVSILTNTPDFLKKENPTSNGSIEGHKKIPFMNTVKSKVEKSVLFETYALCFFCMMSTHKSVKLTLTGERKTRTLVG